MWATGHGQDRDAHFTLQRWWANRLIGVLNRTASLVFEAEGTAALAPGPIALCARHAVGNRLPNHFINRDPGGGGRAWQAGAAGRPPS